MMRFNRVKIFLLVFSLFLVSCSGDGMGASANATSTPSQPPTETVGSTSTFTLTPTETITLTPSVSPTQTTTPPPWTKLLDLRAARCDGFYGGFDGVIITDESIIFDLYNISSDVVMEITNTGEISEIKFTFGNGNTVQLETSYGVILEIEFSSIYIQSDSGPYISTNILPVVPSEPAVICPKISTRGDVIPFDIGIEVDPIAGTVIPGPREVFFDLPVEEWCLRVKEFSGDKLYLRYGFDPGYGLSPERIYDYSVVCPTVTFK